MNKEINIIALAATGSGISGGDRIFIEFARRWAKSCVVNVYVWKEGYEMCQRQLLQDQHIKYRVLPMLPWRKFGFVINYFARIFAGIKIAASLKLENKNSTIIYSASEFWMDSIPALVLKLRFSKIVWVAAWFQTAPNPLFGFAEGKRDERYRLKSLVYFLIQLPIKLLISKFANFVLLNNEIEREQFPSLNKKGKVVIVLGAVDIQEIKKWYVRFKNLSKVYDGVFQGRFHPQKGVLELIDIWRMVRDQKSDAKLVMIGDGPLMKDVKNKIRKLNLEDSIILKGFLFDGEEKYKIFSQSKIVLHPAFYDSGGMASAEAMAFRLPAVGFDLKSFKSYYPQGMIKVKVGDLRFFAQTALKLLNDGDKREKIGRNALNVIRKDWSWDKRAAEVLKAI